MVKVYKTSSEQEIVATGEIIAETKKTFKVHTSSKRYLKRIYSYTKVD